MNEESFRSMLLQRGMVKRLHALSRNVLWASSKDSQLEDVVQAALVSAWERRASFRGTKESEFVGWFLSIVDTGAIDEARRRRIEPLMLGERAGRSVDCART